ncbi:MAG TPA: tetratricopeptide repeat protein [Candidatus Acidoferrum sp.]|nr:tetratricopeptide repeat protein [Candidatus Acidoferrum sp.]
MFAPLSTYLEHPQLIFTSLPSLAFVAFDLWMVIHAVRNREWLWVFFLLAFPFSALWYFFQNYRGSASATSGFELPGAHSRRRIKELQAQIHHLDKAHHHLQLGDIYFQQGKLPLAEAEYRAAIERDGEDSETRAHFGQCLLRLKRPGEARPLLESVVKEDPKHDYGHTMMALAETYMTEGQTDVAIQVWERVLQHYSYARARVQLAELYLAKGKMDGAREQVREVIEGDAHAPAFDRRRNRMWLGRAKKLLGRV